jgi:hypothetical protein
MRVVLLNKRKIYLSVLVFVASNAVILNGIGAFFQNLNDLRFSAHGKNSGMSEPIFSLEKVLVKHIILGNVAVVTGSVLSVRAMVPGGKLWSHNMAVNAGLWVI